MGEFFQSKVGKIILLVASIILIIVLIISGVNLTKKPGSNGALSDGENGSSTEKTGEPSHADILDEESSKEEEGHEIFYVPKDEINGFSMTDSNGILISFEKKGKKWVYTDDESLKLNQERIESVLNYLSDIKFIDEIETKDGLEYELDQNSPMYVITDASGNATIISLGKMADDESGKVYFALNYDFTKIYTNSGKLSKVSEYSIEELVTP